MPANTASLPYDPELRHSLAQSVRQLLADAGAPGAGLALLLDGQPLLVAAAGYRDLERTVAITSAAQFYLYSLTKSLLAAAILQLVAPGRLALDTPVQAYLPQVSLAAPVTVRQLLNHTGGIPDYSDLPSYYEAVKARPAHPWTPGEFLAATLPRGLDFAPGQAWRYSNVGYLLLRQLLERVTGGSLQAALTHHIFAPLGLQQTFVAASLADARSLAPGYSQFFSPDGSLQDIAPLYHPGWVSHGLVISTAPETARMFDALFAGRLLSPQLLAEMLVPILVPDQHPLFRQPAYGLGLMIDTQSKYGVMAGHGGGGPGYSAGALHFTGVNGRRITSVALANRDQPDLGLNLAFTMATLLADFVLLGGSRSCSPA